MYIILCKHCIASIVEKILFQKQYYFNKKNTILVSPFPNIRSIFATLQDCMIQWQNFILIEEKIFFLLRERNIHYSNPKLSHQHVLMSFSSRELDSHSKVIFFIRFIANRSNRYLSAQLSKQRNFNAKILYCQLFARIRYTYHLQRGGS